MSRPRITPEERSGARKAFSRKNPGGVSPAAKLFAEILALSIDEAALGIALRHLDPDTLQPLPAAKDPTGLSKVRRRQLRHALESAGFLRSPAAARLCGKLRTDPRAALLRVRGLAGQKEARARVLLEREAKARRNAAAAEAMRLARRDAAAGIRIHSPSDLIPDDAESFRGEDLAGRAFGLLTVVRRGGLKGHMRLWEVRCRCGTVKQIARKMIGRVHSCGCALPETVWKAVPPPDRGPELASLS